MLRAELLGLGEAAPLTEGVDWRLASSAGESWAEPLNARAAQAFVDLRNAVAVATGEPARTVLAADAAPAIVIDRQLVERLYAVLSAAQAENKGGACARVAIMAIAPGQYPGSVRMVARKAEYYVECVSSLGRVVAVADWKFPGLPPGTVGRLSASRRGQAGALAAAAGTASLIGLGLAVHAAVKR